MPNRRIGLPYCAVGAIGGFIFACFFSYGGHPKAGILLVPVFIFLGLCADLTFFGWRVYWTWTQECAWCGRRVHPLTRNRYLSNDLKNSKHWFCGPRCYLEFDRRYRTERKQINILNEGGPLISTGRD